MAKKAKDAIKEDVKLEMTPMIDVTFLILIFFMCTLKFKTLEGKLVSYLPTDKGLSSAKEELQKEDAEIQLKVRKIHEGVNQWTQIKNPLKRVVTFMRIGSNEPFGICRRVKMGSSGRVMGFDFDPPDVKDRVMEYLKTIKEADPGAKAKINSYARTPHVYVVTVLNWMMEAGFEEISYSGIPNSLVKDLQSGELK